MKHLFITLVISILFLQNVWSQRPESMYVRKGLSKTGQSAQKVEKQKTKISFYSSSTCDDCDIISFDHFSPDSTFTSVYAYDSIWVHTYDAVDPDLVWSGGYLNFTEKCFNFMHYVDNTYGAMSYWDGFTVSKTTAIPFPCDTACYDACNGLESQFSATPGGGVNGANDPYIVAYYGYNNIYFPENHCLVSMNEAKSLCGMYITNNAYAVKAMKCGDFFADKFTIGDSLVLTINGYNNGAYAGKVDFFLADYRTYGSEYIVEDWEWVSLSSLGTIDSLVFEITTSDVGMYGANTPMYFCMDEITINDENCESCERSEANRYSTNQSVTIDVQINPNPTTTYINISATVGSTIEIRDKNNALQYKTVLKSENGTISVEEYPQGVYYVTALKGETIGTAKFIKQ